MKVDGNLSRPPLDSRARGVVGRAEDLIAENRRLNATLTN